MREASVIYFTKKHYFLFTLIFLPLICLFLLFDPIEQDQSYHLFADKMNYFGISNAHNVMSNFLFLAFPLLGFIRQFQEKQEMQTSWNVFLIGVFLVAPGSAYYHYNPSNATLVWDRLPMAIAFMGLSSFVFKDVFQIKKEALLLSSLLIIGVYSIFHWVYFQDLRLYAWVQLTPILSLLYVAFILPTPCLKTKHLCIAILFYVLAKLTERFDLEIFELISYSGHSMKHILAAFSVLSLILMKNQALHDR